MVDVRIRGKVEKVGEWKAKCDKSKAILATAKAFHQKQTDFKTLVLSGPPGTGKTHLAKRLVGMAQKEKRKAIYWTLQGILSYCKRCMDAPEIENIDSFLQFLHNFPGLLVIDEIGRSKGGDWDKNQVLFPIMEARQDMHNILATNYNDAQLVSRYDASILSRMKIGGWLDFSGIVDHRGQR